MTVTDEMIEAVSKALVDESERLSDVPTPQAFPEDWPSNEADEVRSLARAALTAALRVAPVGGVKELEWVQVAEHSAIPQVKLPAGKEYRASTPWGSYRIHSIESGPVRFSAFWEHKIIAPGDALPTLEAAKTACQSDFARRVSECLKAPAGVVDRERIHNLVHDAMEVARDVGDGSRPVSDGMKAHITAVDAILSTLTTREDVEREVIERLRRNAKNDMSDFSDLQEWDDWLRSQGSAS